MKSRLLVLSIVIGSALGFVYNGAVLSASRLAPPSGQYKVLRMANDDPLGEIRAKMQADPNYNPMTDPSATAALDAILPDYLKEIPNAIERLNVAFKDATSSANALNDLDAAVSSFSDKRELISSPQSDLFSEAGRKPPDSGEVERLIKQLRQQFPEVPYE
jgi:hypothetical protein